jgi:hypothetical protein
MSRKGFLAAASMLVVLLAVPATQAQETGDALQLLSYGVSPTTAPNVLDGQIAAASDPADWQSAYVRVVRVGINGDPAADPRPATLLVANDANNLYLGVAVELPNAAQNNRLTVYFDGGSPGTLEGSASQVGEYYITALADGSAPEDGHWNGTGWSPNSVPAVQGVGLRKGTSGADRLYNFEFVIPLQRAGDASNSYLDMIAGEEVGLFPVISLNTSDEYYWLDTNDNPTDPSAVAGTGEAGWGQIRTIGSGIADRNVVSLGALSIIPTIDGDISGDENWRYAFRKDIVLSDFAGGKLDATLRLKDRTGPENLLVGLTVNDFVPAAGDYLAVYLDQGSNGGPLNYVLTDGGDPIADNGARVTGTGSFQDLYFDSDNWVADAASDGVGAGAVSGAGDWEVEMSLPFDSGDPQDLNIALEDGLGFLLEYRDSASGHSYWWSATINDNDRVIDPVDPVNNALGWGFLQTGGPFIQPIYPEDGDVLSGEYPLAVYAVDPGDATPETGIERIRYEVRQEDPVAGTFVTLLSGNLSKVEDPGIAIWTATLDTRAINVAPSVPLSLVFEVFDGEVDPVSVPIAVFVDNSGSLTSLDDPTVTVDSPSGGEIVSGPAVNVAYSASTNELLTLDLLELLVDGTVVDTITPTGFNASGTYTLDTSTLLDGEHILQGRAVNSLGFENVSPAVLIVVDNGPPVIEDLSIEYPDGQVAAAAGQNITVSALVSDSGVGVLAGSVLLEASSVDAGSSSGLTMVDDGTGGDAVAGDNRYTAVLTVTNASSGIEPFTVSASDALDNTSDVSGTVRLDNLAPSVLNIVVLDADNIYANGETISLEATFDAADYAVRADGRFRRR